MSKHIARTLLTVAVLSLAACAGSRGTALPPNPQCPKCRAGFEYVTTATTGNPFTAARAMMRIRAEALGVTQHIPGARIETAQAFVYVPPGHGQLRMVADRWVELTIYHAIADFQPGTPPAAELEGTDETTSLAAGWYSVDIETSYPDGSDVLVTIDGKTLTPYWE